jgi:hypothetical protein
LGARLIGGWQFGGILNFRTGRPLSITSGVGTFNRNAISDSNTVDLSTPTSISDLRELTGRKTLSTGPNASGIFWLDPNLANSLFTLPQPGRAGTLSQTPIFGPKRFVMDINLSKRTRITEKTNLEFRWEVFNLFNNVNFGVPNTNIRSIGFGQIFRTVSNPRLMQFALKLNF